MTTKVTKESLAENIGRLESYGDLSINEEYQLKAYRLLLAKMVDETTCIHVWTYSDTNMVRTCDCCGLQELAP